MRSTLDQSVIALHDQAAHPPAAGVACQAIFLQDGSDLRIEARCFRGVIGAARDPEHNQATGGVDHGPAIPQGVSHING